MDGSIIIGTELDNSKFDSQIALVESKMQEIEDKLKKADMGFDVGDTIKLEAEYDNLASKLNTLKIKKEEANKIDFSNVEQNVGKIGNSIGEIIQKVIRWGLAVFGIRSAYLAVRQAASTLSQYNKQISSDLSYIQFALATALQPIIQGLISLVFKILSYVNYLAEAWFHVNLFANASSKKFLEASNNANKMNKSLLSGIDQITNLDDAASTTVPPSFDLSSMHLTDQQVPSWLKWIKDNGQLIADVVLAIAGAVTLMTLGFTGFQTLGIAILFEAIWQYLQDFQSFVNDPTVLGFSKIIGDIAIAVGALALIIGGPTGLVLIVTSAVLGLVALIIANWDTIKKFFDVAITAIIDVFKQPFLLIRQWIDDLKVAFGNFADGIKALFSGNFANGISLIFKGIANVVIGILNWLIDAVNDVISPVRSLIVAFGAVTGKNWTMDRSEEHTSELQSPDHLV